MRIAEVKMNEKIAGRLTGNETGYHFVYDEDYLKTSGQAISLTLPLREAPYTSRTLFPFFDGLIPEGWLLDIAKKNWKLNTNDRMGILLACCKDCIGAVSVHPIENENEDE